MSQSLDDQEKAIARQLIRNPRATDISISEATGVQLRTVGRKRQKLEQSGRLRYWASIDLGEGGTGQFNTTHLYIIKFAIGVTYEQLHAAISHMPLINELTPIIAESHIAEIDGNLAMLYTIEGTSDRDIVRNVHERLLPNLVRNHGPNSIQEVSTLRLLGPVRVLRNYLPSLNMA
ncbi:MAG TPA: hypothetical protein VIO38_17500, partial [Rariglobus sp.]